MELYLRCEGREEKVVAERTEDGRYRVELGDAVYEVDPARAGASWSLIIGGRQSEATVSPDGHEPGKSTYWVSTEHGNHRVELLEPLAYLTAQRGASEGRTGAQSVQAYMPGRVVSLLLQEGASVRAGQGVLVLEAMKMENEIQAESDGIIAKIHVEPGTAVEAGDALFDVRDANG